MIFNSTFIPLKTYDTVYKEMDKKAGENKAEFKAILLKFLDDYEQWGNKVLRKIDKYGAREIEKLKNDDLTGVKTLLMWNHYKKITDKFYWGLLKEFCYYLLRMEVYTDGFDLSIAVFLNSLRAVIRFDTEHSVELLKGSFRRYSEIEYIQGYREFIEKW